MVPLIQFLPLIVDLAPIVQLSTYWAIFFSFTLPKGLFPAVLKEFVVSKVLEPANQRALIIGLE